MDILRYYSQHYLSSIEVPLLKYVESLTIQEAGRYEINAAMVDESLLEGCSKEAFLQTARTKLLALCNKLMSVICETPVPETIKFLLKEAQHHYAEKYPESSHSASVSLLLLRLVIPHVASLQGYHRATNRIFIRSGQIILCVASGTHLKSDGAGRVDEWIDSKRSQLSNFLKTASTTLATLEQVDKEASKLPLKSENIDALSAFFVQRPAFMNDLRSKSATLQ